jgi:ABC-type uncharacterized transport system permease subunit
VKSHFLHMLLYSTIVSTFFALLMRRTRYDRLRFGAALWLVMVGGALVLAYLMYPFPG